MNINIQALPPTSADIEAARKPAIAAISLSEKRKQLIKYASVFYASAKKELASLSPMAIEHWPAVPAWRQTEPAIAQYQSAVAVMGRQLIEAEYAAMQEWMVSKSAQESAAIQQAACDALASPINQSMVS